MNDFMRKLHGHVVDEQPQKKTGQGNNSNHKVNSQRSQQTTKGGSESHQNRKKTSSEQTAKNDG